jgi:LPXTG-motif cell wall-anchored protein
VSATFSAHFGDDALILSASGPGWTCSGNPVGSALPGPIALCTNPDDLAVGENSIVTLTVTNVGCTPGAIASSASPDPDVSNNTTGEGCVDSLSGGGVSGTPFAPPASNIGTDPPELGNTAPGGVGSPVTGVPFDPPRANIPADTPESTSDAPNPAPRLQRNEIPLTGPVSSALLSGLGVTLLISGAGLVSLARRKEHLRGQTEFGQAC